MRIALLAPYPLHLIPGYEDETRRGHYATWLPQLSEVLAANKEFEFHWVTVARKVRRKKPTICENQVFHTIYVPEKFRPLRLYTRDTMLIRAKLDDLAPDLVHAWGTEDCYGFAAARSHRRFLLSMQGLLGVYTQRCKSALLEHLQARIEGFIFRRTRFVTVESTWGCEILKREIPSAKVFRVEYGVSEMFYEIKWNPDPNKPVAIFAGTIDHRKGIEDAVAAFSSPELQKSELWILGDREHRLARALRARSPLNVHWLGRLDRKSTAEAMARAWCLVLPTRADTSPNVVKEARVIGLPVITTPHGGQTDYVIDQQTGWIVEPGDIKSLTDRLRRTLGDFNLACRLGNSRHEEHRNWFKPENTGEGFLQIYRELCQAGLLQVAA
jgi:glycosyltransferase involved in cell wall biosynthesis